MVADPREADSSDYERPSRSGEAKPASWEETAKTALAENDSLNRAFALCRAQRDDAQRQVNELNAKLRSAEAQLGGASPHWKSYPPGQAGAKATVGASGEATGARPVAPEGARDFTADEVVALLNAALGHGMKR